MVYGAVHLALAYGDNGIREILTNELVNGRFFERLSNRSFHTFRKLIKIGKNMNYFNKYDVVG